MSTALKLDDTGDIDFDANTGVFNTVEDDDELIQRLNILLGINLGELAWNEDIGIDQNDLLINGDDQSVVQSIIDDYLRDQLDDSYQGITIKTFTVDREQRLTSLSADVTIDDETYTANLAIENEAELNGDDDSATDEG